MPLRIKRTGQRTSPTLPTVAPQSVVVTNAKVSFKQGSRLTKEEIADIRHWLTRAAKTARTIERVSGARRSILIETLMHTHP